ncbi:MAG: Alginate biosynthesis protein AlgA [Candidatus Omnitrophica bacterium]|nr:Alginate biosynthesis protein AlgA [Candidatus Omnitrophota bacterium]
MPQAVIMAGGIGERFWPLTSADFPKYRIRYDGRSSLLSSTYARLARVYGAARVHVITGRDHVRHVRAELTSLSSGNLHIEPFRNNTASAIHLTCEILRQRCGGEEVVSFYPADHLIQDTASFAGTMRAAIRLAGSSRTLVTIGIRPTFAATGYGYIERGQAIRGTAGAHTVRRFVEKPDSRRAAAYLKGGRHAWNAGIFTWRLSTYYGEMERHAPQFTRLKGVARLRAAYRRLPALSIDYALMERTRRVTVLSTRMDWCDMGSWDMYYEKAPKDAAGNAVIGGAVLKDCENCLVHDALPGRARLSGLKDTIVVRTHQGMLVCPRGASESAARWAAQAS